MQVQSLDQQDPLEEEGMAARSSIPPWGIPWTEKGAWQAAVHRVAELDTTKGYTPYQGVVYVGSSTERVQWRKLPLAADGSDSVPQFILSVT